MSIGERIRTLREGEKLSLRDLGERCKISPSHLSLIERGRTQPTIERLASIARGLNVSLETLTSADESLNVVALPPGLQQVRDNASLRIEIDEDWIRLLAGLSLRGRRPRTREEWIQLYLVMRPFFSEK